MSTQLSVQGNFQTTPGGVNVNLFIDVPSPVGARVLSALASGFNQFTIPTGTTVVLVQLPTGNAVAVTIKGVTGDTGLLMQPAGGVFMFMPTVAQTTFSLTAAGAIATLTTIYYL